MGMSRMERKYLLYKMSCIKSSGLTESQERTLAGMKLVKGKRSTNMEIRAGVPPRERERKEEEEQLESEAAEAEKKQKEEEEACERETRKAAEREAKFIKLPEEKYLSLGPEPEKRPDVTQDIQNRKRILRLCINVLLGHKIKHICFSADGRHLATASDDGVRIFQLDDASSKSFNCVKLQMPPSTFPTALCYADLSFVFATTTDMGKTKKASLYMVVEDDTNTKTFCTKWHQDKVDPIEKLLGAELNGTTVLVTGADAKGRNMRVWYGRFGKELCKLKVILTHAKNNVMAISPSGRYIAAAATHDNKVKVWELKDGKNCPTKVESSTQAKEDLRTPLAFTLGSHEDEVTGICFTPDSQRIITTSKGGFLRVWLISDSGPKIIDTPIKLITYSPQDFTDTKYYNHLSISPDGKMLAVAGASLLRWISVESWNLLETVGRAHYGNIKCLAWAPARIRVGDKHDFVLATVGEDEFGDDVKLWAAPSDT